MTLELLGAVTLAVVALFLIVGIGCSLVMFVQFIFGR